MNQDYKNVEFVLSSEEKKKTLIISDDTGNEGGKPRPDGKKVNSQGQTEEDDAE